MGNLKENKQLLEAKLLSGEPIYKLYYDRRQTKELVPMTLTKVGNKYAECGYEKIDIEELTHFEKNYSPSYKVYLNKEDYENEILKFQLVKTINELIGNCSLDKIKMIHAEVVWDQVENKTLIK